MSVKIRLKDLLPPIYSQDIDGAVCPLCAILEIIEDQVNVVENDILQLYNNWFIETCQDWVVPYIGDLIGYSQMNSGAEQSTLGSTRQKDRILTPRRDVANTIRYRRGKGTLSVLESISQDVSGWTVRCIEMFTSLAFTQNLNHLRTNIGRSADLAKVGTFGEPFSELAHLADLRSGCCDARGYNTNGVGIFVWRLKPYSVTRTPAEESGPKGMFTFSALGNDEPLFINPDQEATSGPLGVPMAINRIAFESRKEDYYGEGKSLLIWAGTQSTKRTSSKDQKITWQEVKVDDVIPANLSRWQYAPDKGKVAVDPELGRIAFSKRNPPVKVLVSYQYGFSDDIGGGEYPRQIYQPEDFELYSVGQGGFNSVTQAFDRWQEDKKNAVEEGLKKRLHHAVIEIAESGVFTAPAEISLAKDESLHIRAANRVRPMVKAVDLESDSFGNLAISGETGSSFTIDGLIISEGGVSITGDIARIAIRHSTIVPGHRLHEGCEPDRCPEPSLDLHGIKSCVYIDHSIIGPIKISGAAEPLNIHIVSSILDALGSGRLAIGFPGGSFAPVELTIKKTTVLGSTDVQAIRLAENSIFCGPVNVARTQRGCMRFCYVPRRPSRTPKRYNCQPDMVIQKAPVGEMHKEALRVRPQFKGEQYGKPNYCRLSDNCAEEIRRGSEDESEMGVFHDLYEPQRRANLEARLEDYMPARMNANIVFVS